MIVCSTVIAAGIAWAVVGKGKGKTSPHRQAEVSWRSLSITEIQNLKIDSPRLVRPSDSRPRMKLPQTEQPGSVNDEYLGRVDNQLYGVWLNFDVYNSNKIEAWDIVVDLKCRMPSGEWRTYGAVGTAKIIAPPRSWSRATVELTGIPDSFGQWTPVISSAKTIR